MITQPPDFETLGSNSGLGCFTLTYDYYYKTMMKAQAGTPAKFVMASFSEPGWYLTVEQSRLSGNLNSSYFWFFDCPAKHFPVDLADGNYMNVICGCLSNTAQCQGDAQSCIIGSSLGGYNTPFGMFYWNFYNNPNSIDDDPPEGIGVYWWGMVYAMVQQNVTHDTLAEVNTWLDPAKSGPTPAYWSSVLKNIKCFQANSHGSNSNTIQVWYDIVFTSHGQLNCSPGPIRRK